MSKQTMNIWDRDLELDIRFDCFDDEEVTLSQKEALDSFLNHKDIINNVKNEVMEYCLKNNNGLLKENSISNIFKYVVPQTIYVSRTKDNSHLVSVMCAYKFDEEHGIAIIFENEKFKTIDIQDAIL